VTAASRRLAVVRHAIDAVDGGSLLLLAVRGRLAEAAGSCKRAQAGAIRDPAREARVHARGQRLGARLGLSPATARAALALAIDDACGRQQVADDLGQGTPAGLRATIGTMHDHAHEPAWERLLLRSLPPPRRLAPLLRAVPPSIVHRLLRRACLRVLAQAMVRGDLDFMHERRLGIEVTDLGLRWTVAIADGRLQLGDGEAEASVRGTATDLLLLAARLEDADTLFFQRRLMLTGDTELGLTVRNLLDRLPWETVPLGVRIGLNRGARLARLARQVHHDRA
jgi:O2-independent ubiquinone biosynthesis accessory factor UbiT